MVWEQRWHPLREEWVTITSHRNTRPWSGSVAEQGAEAPSYDGDCYLCPGNRRVSGQVNEDYRDLFVFDNDHPSFQLEAGELSAAYGIYQNRPATGITRVICYAPEHNLTLAELSLSHVRQLVTLWCDQTRELVDVPEINQVFIFENKGEVVGVSNPHPHGQIYATATTFKTLETEGRAQERHYRETGRGLFEDIIASECADGRRIIVENDNCLAFVPWFARFPYETFVVPRRSVSFIHELDASALDDLAATLREVLVRYDNLWRMSFPYMMVLHQAPCDGVLHPEFHFHIQIHPPLRGPGLQKFLAGVETGGGAFLNDACPEDAAAQLKAVDARHYRTRG